MNVIASTEVFVIPLLVIVNGTFVFSFIRVFAHISILAYLDLLEVSVRTSVHLENMA